MTPTPGQGAARGPLLASVVAAVAHLAVGNHFLFGGVLVPPPVLLPLWGIWLTLSAWLVWVTVLRSWSVLVVPVVAVVFLGLTALGGAALFGYS